MIVSLFSLSFLQNLRMVYSVNDAFTLQGFFVIMLDKSTVILSQTMTLQLSTTHCLSVHHPEQGLLKVTHSCQSH